MFVWFLGPQWCGQEWPRWPWWPAAHVFLYTLMKSEKFKNPKKSIKYPKNPKKIHKISKIQKKNFKISLEIVFDVWPMVVTMATMAWMTAVFFLCEDEEKILRKTQKKLYNYKNSQKQYFFIKISFEIMSAFWRYIAIYYCVYFFFKRCLAADTFWKIYYSVPLLLFMLCVWGGEKREEYWKSQKKL